MLFQKDGDFVRRRNDDSTVHDYIQETNGNFRLKRLVFHKKYLPHEPHWKLDLTLMK